MKAAYEAFSDVVAMAIFFGQFTYAVHALYVHVFG